MSLIKIWAPHFQSSVRMRGREYQSQGLVRRLPAHPGELARAQVNGSRVYTVVIRGEGSGAVANCDCPFFAGGAYCKHIWAVILDLHHNPLANDDADAEGGSGVSSSLNDSGVSPPRAQRRGARAAAPPPPREPDWVGLLRLMRTPSSGTRAAGTGAAPGATPPGPIAPRRIWYMIEPEACLQVGALAVTLHSSRPIRAGWSKPKPIEAREDLTGSLIDPMDRQLCSLLRGPQRVQSWGIDGNQFTSAGTPLVIPAESRHWFIQAMLKTGRCGLSPGEGVYVPLEWDGDEPWSLFVAGTSDAGALEVMPDLRRGDSRMPIGKPHLILGGENGLVCYDQYVAPFLDNGAFRWVTHFREPMRYGQSLQPLRIDKADVRRFVDSLYELPGLPDVDLPPEVGVAEQRVEPVPHLDIHNPERHDLASASVPRGHLLARVWYDYAGRRVKPGQAGRFLRERAGNGNGDSDATESTSHAPAATEGDSAESTGESARDGEAGAGDDAPDKATPTLLTRRDLGREERAIETLVAQGLRPLGAGGGNGDAAASLSVAASVDTFVLSLKRLPQIVAALLPSGWIITADKLPIRSAGAPRLSVTAGIDWFELHGELRFKTEAGEQTVTLPELLKALQDGRMMVRLGDGSQGLLPEEWLKRQGLMAAMGKIEGDHIRFQLGQAALLDAMLDRRELEYVDARFEEARQRLSRFKAIEPRSPSSTFTGTLRPYQSEGLGWLAFLRWMSAGGVLADDMGLGKTVQVLAMLESRYTGHQSGEETEAAAVSDSKIESEVKAGTTAPDSAPAHLPSIIVVPRSVVFNWLDEAGRFAPRLRVQAYTGTDRSALREAFRDHDVIVTTYGLLRRDISELTKHKFDYVVLDEAQAIKNPGSQSAKAARLLEARHRLALTGTPVENHLGDLWSIFDFLNPGMLGSNTGFGRLIRGEGLGGANGAEGTGVAGDDERLPADDEEEAMDMTAGAMGTGGAGGAGGEPRLRTNRRGIDPGATTAVAAALKPFILRRTKQQVLRDLPEKTEQTIVCQLEPAQRELYDQLRTHYRQSLLVNQGLFNGASSGGGSPSSSSQLNGPGAIMVLEALLRLRQAACHPGLIDKKRIDEPSAKMEVLIERLGDMIEEGHKALVFSQFTSLLAIVRKRLDERGMVYEYLDGQTRDRGARVNRFQTDPACPLFLISLKAGGLGLNLTAAEYVFILDPWWNPAVESQAIDRAHRIGQTRHVFAYRLICEDTVEQRIAELQSKKKKLADAIIGGQENLLKTLTREDLERLLG